MKIKTAVTINGHLVNLIGKVSKSISLYELGDDYGTDLFMVDSTGNVIGSIRVVSEDIYEIKIGEVD